MWSGIGAEFPVWFLAFGVMIGGIGCGILMGSWPDMVGRYGRSWLRWFKVSLLLNLTGWVVMGCLWMATASYFQQVQAQREVALRTDLTQHFASSLTDFTAKMNRIEESAMAAEDALTKWFDTVKEH